MRIADRIRNLERRSNDDPRMTAPEIEAAAARYESMLDPCADPERARSTWRACVSAAASGWLQRIYADMAPEDFHA